MKSAEEWEKIFPYQPDQPLGPWIERIQADARNAALDEAAIATDDQNDPLQVISDLEAKLIHSDRVYAITLAQISLASLRRVVEYIKSIDPEGDDGAAAIADWIDPLTELGGGK